MNLFYKYPAVLVLYLLYACNPLLAQEYNYVHYDANNGLPGNNVYKMVQDKDGFCGYRQMRA
jgi:cobalamin biosynthesis protein CobD/CbiB